MRFSYQLGSILASCWPSWAGLAASWGVFGASWRLLAHLGASWVRLGASLARPAAFWGLLARKVCQQKPDLTWNGKRRSFWKLAMAAFGSDLPVVDLSGSFTETQETTRRNRKNNIPSASAASEGAQRAKRAERLRCSKGYSSGFLGRFTETTEKNTTSQAKRK